MVCRILGENIASKSYADIAAVIMLGAWNSHVTLSAFNSIIHFESAKIKAGSFVCNAFGSSRSLFP